jgi:hypothetical protein
MSLFWKSLSSTDDVRKLVHGLEWSSDWQPGEHVGGEYVYVAEAGGGLTIRAKSSFSMKLRPRSMRPEVRWVVSGSVKDGARWLRASISGVESRKAGACAVIAALVLARKPYRYGLL